MTLLQHFIAFVNEQATQNPDRLIDHDSWETCALGDFVRAKSEEIGEPIPDRFGNWVDLAVRTFGAGSDLDSFMASCTPDGDRETYGQLAEALHDFDSEGNYQHATA